MCICTTPSCNLLVSSGLALVQYHRYHFYLKPECCPECPTSWLGGSENTQFMMGSSGCVVTWWQKLKHSVSTKAQEQVKRCFSKGESLSAEDDSTFLQNPEYSL